MSRHEKKHILMVVYTLYPFDARVRREAEALAAEPDYEVTVLTLRQQACPRSYVLEGVQVRELNAAKYRGSSTSKYLLSYLRFLVLALAACTGRFLRGLVDVVHVHNMPNILVLAGIVPKLMGRKVVLDVHDTMVETYLSKFSEGRTPKASRLLALEERACCGIADKLICVNNVQKMAMVVRGIPASKIEVSMNVPDPRIFGIRSAATADSLNDRDSFRLVYHGTIARRLGLDLAIRAIGLLKKDIPNLEYRIIGSGEVLEELKRQAAEQGVSENVRFCPPVPLEEIPSVLRLMDVGLVSNRRDAATELMLPVKMLEYISQGIPVVVPRLRAIRHYFSDEMVTYFEPEDVGSLAAAVRELYEAPEKRRARSEAAKEFLVRYGWEVARGDFLAFYAKLFERHGNGG